jgi:hypothetical protein
MYMTAPLDVGNHRALGPVLCTAEVSPQRDGVVHDPVHTSSTEYEPRHLRLCGLSTEVTGPMTTMRLKKDGSRSEYLGTNGSSSSQVRGWPRVLVALRSIRTSVCDCQHSMHGEG